MPGIVISPYAKRGYIDHQNLGFDAYLKFIEDDFLQGQRIDPKTDGRPDPRPDVPENASTLGDLPQESMSGLAVPAIFAAQKFARRVFFISTTCLGACSVSMYTKQ